MKYFVLAFFLCIQTVVTTFGQNRFSLEEVIKQAQSNSLEAFRNKHSMRKAYFSYQNFKTSFLPQIGIRLVPVDYSNNLSQIYNSTSGLAEYAELNTIDSYGGIVLSQKVKALGGDIHLFSDLRLFKNMSNYGEVPSSTNYITTPININYTQTLFRTNPYKWESKLASLEFENKLHEFIQEQENIALLSINYFFELLGAQKQLEIARNNHMNDSLLYDMGKNRIGLATITKDDLMQLKLHFNQSQIRLQKAKTWEEYARKKILTFLEYPIDTNFSLSLPRLQKVKFIEVSEVLLMVKKNNPLLLAKRYEIIKKLQQFKDAKKERYQVKLGLNFGLYNQNNSVVQAYRSPNNSTNININISIPIVDWGKNKRMVRQYEYDLKQSEWEADRKETELINQLTNEIQVFNQQVDLISQNQLQTKLTNDMYTSARQRYTTGELSVFNLTILQQQKDQAWFDYLNSLQTYYQSYYMLRSICLYDFEQKQTLKDTVKQEYF